MTTKIHGHQRQLDYLYGLLARHNLPHALLFHGPKCIGKRTTALALAAAIFQNHNETHAHKALLHAGNHPDFHFLQKEDGKKEISVEQVRDLLSKLTLRPYYNGAIVAIIDDAHLLNKTASNALLKTLEEPHAQTYLILISDSPHALLETIISRCQALSFGRLSENHCHAIISEIAQKLDLSPSAVESLAMVTNGSLEALGIDRFIQKATNNFTALDELREYLHGFSKNAAATANQVQRILLFTEAGNYSKLLGELNQILSEGQPSPLFWIAFRNKIRSHLRNATGDALLFWSSLLKETIETETAIGQRNCNPHVQMSALLLKDTAQTINNRY